MKSLKHKTITHALPIFIKNTNKLYSYSEFDARSLERWHPQISEEEGRRPGRNPPWSCIFLCVSEGTCISLWRPRLTQRHNWESESWHTRVGMGGTYQTRRVLCGSFGVCLMHSYIHHTLILYILVLWISHHKHQQCMPSPPLPPPPLPPHLTALLQNSLLFLFTSLPYSTHCSILLFRVYFWFCIATIKE